MKTLLLLTTAALVFGMTGISRAADSEKKPMKPQLRHVVAFKFKAETKPDEMEKVVKDFAALPGKISEIAAFEWGTNNSAENLNKGCTHCFTLTFPTEKNRDAYLVHPAHKEFVGLVGPLIDEVFVIDYWAK